MEPHTGIVQRVGGGKAVVAVATGGCGGCGHQSGCGIGRLAGGRQQTLVEVELPPASAAGGPAVAAGDQVTLLLAKDRLLAAALLGYLLPAITLIAGAVGGSLLAASDGQRDALGAAGALLGLIAGVALPRLAARRWPGLRLQPRLAAGGERP